MLKKLFALAALALSVHAVAEVKTITDVVGREVKVDVPAKRIMLGFYYTDYLAVGGEKALDNVVGFSKAVWTDWTPSSWEVYSKALPKLNELEDVGEVEVGTFSVEKVLSLKPDLIVLADWQWQALEMDLDAVHKLGIPVVVLDYNKEQLDLHLKSTELLGVITGQEERAKELATWYEGVIKDVHQRIDALNIPKVKAYIEFGNKGPKESGNSFGNTMWGPLAVQARAANIAEGVVEYAGPMNPEAVIAAQPEVVFITGRETELKKNPEGMVMGINITEDEAQKRLAAYKNRTGWAELPAIKAGRLHGIYQGASRTLADAASIQYIAKALYPEAFQDIDPLQTYLDYHKKYLPITPEGTFFIQAK
ncbi:MAG: ABC transporter substrate-binding protein [Cardiobacteriaceae bacterium]|nr:ABC transporter substrate-binding protein [Cardiobacteriaceae bacterium]